MFIALTPCLCTLSGRELLKVKGRVVFISLAPLQNPKYSGCSINSGWMDGWADGGMDGRMDGWMDEKLRLGV